MIVYTYENKNEMDLTTDDFIEYMCEGIESKKLQEKVNKKNTVFSYSSLLNSTEANENINLTFQIKDIPKKKQTLQFPKEIML